MLEPAGSHLLIVIPVEKLVGIGVEVDGLEERLQAALNALSVDERSRLVADLLSRLQGQEHPRPTSNQ